MATLVGTQAEFAKAVRELVELDFDAVEAYKTAINRLENINYRNRLQQFKKDHERHISELNAVLDAHGEKKVEKPSMKQWLTKAKVVISDIMGNDINVLKAMNTNEQDTNTAYERINKYKDKWVDAIEPLKKGLKDEKRHKKWIQYAISSCS
ncbi:DUF2383 domain-containing protein [Francisella hispaniensis]|uniref:DUF2383 domain-containing protein n=1 Tax=Francisella hispaniensis TaxID=622488 RepID=UPI0008FF0691|nr:DUF2383 domain-containing protein [Francisella hispaniensis]